MNSIGGNEASLRAITPIKPGNLSIIVGVDKLQNHFDPKIDLLNFSSLHEFVLQSWVNWDNLDLRQGIQTLAQIEESDHRHKTIDSAIRSLAPYVGLKIFALSPPRLDRNSPIPFQFHNLGSQYVSEQIAIAQEDLGFTPSPTILLTNDLHAKEYFNPKKHERLILTGHKQAVQVYWEIQSLYPQYIPIFRHPL